ALRAIIPGSAHWPRFAGNASQQFEARTAAVEILASKAVLLDGMAGSQLPVAIAHGEGRALVEGNEDLARLQARRQVALRYIDNYGRATQAYPANPSGSAGGLTALCNGDGRVLLTMVHPERVVRSSTLAWKPADWHGPSPWARMFANARRFLG